MESTTGSTTSHRERITLTISVTKTDFDIQASQLHVSGRITEETKHTRIGQHHTLDLELHREFKIEKSEGWDSVAIETVKEACDPVKKAECWAVVMQEGLANIAVLTGSRTVFRQNVDMRVRTKGEKGKGKGGKVRQFVALAVICAHVERGS